MYKVYILGMGLGSSETGDEVREAGMRLGIEVSEAGDEVNEARMRLGRLGMR